MLNKKMNLNLIQDGDFENLINKTQDLIQILYFPQKETNQMNKKLNQIGKTCREALKLPINLREPKINSFNEQWNVFIKIPSEFIILPFLTRIQKTLQSSTTVLTSKTIAIFQYMKQQNLPSKLHQANNFNTKQQSYKDSLFGMTLKSMEMQAEQFTYTQQKVDTFTDHLLRIQRELQDPKYQFCALQLKNEAFSEIERMLNFLKQLNNYDENCTKIIQQLNEIGEQIIEILEQHENMRFSNKQLPKAPFINSSNSNFVLSDSANSNSSQEQGNQSPNSSSKLKPLQLNENDEEEGNQIQQRISSPVKNSRILKLENDGLKLDKVLAEEQNKLSILQLELQAINKEAENRRKQITDLQITKSEQQVISQYEQLLKQKQQLNNEIQQLDKQKQQLELIEQKNKPKEQQQKLYLDILHMENQYYNKLLQAVTDFNKQTQQNINDYKILTDELKKQKNQTGSRTVVFNTSQLREEYNRCHSAYQTALNSHEFMSNKHDEITQIDEKQTAPEDIKLACDILTSDSKIFENQKHDLEREIQHINESLSKYEEETTNFRCKIDEIDSESQMTVFTLQKLIRNIQSKMQEIPQIKSSSKKLPPLQLRTLDRTVFDDLHVIYDEILDLRNQYKAVKSSLDQKTPYNGNMLDAEEGENLLDDIADDLNQKTNKLKKDGVLQMYEDLHKKTRDYKKFKEIIETQAKRGQEQQVDFFQIEPQLDEMEMRLEFSNLQLRKSNVYVDFDKEILLLLMRSVSNIFALTYHFKLIDEWVNEKLGPGYENLTKLQKIDALIEKLSS